MRRLSNCLVCRPAFRQRWIVSIPGAKARAEPTIKKLLDGHRDSEDYIKLWRERLRAGEVPITDIKAVRESIKAHMERLDSYRSMRLTVRRQEELLKEKKEEGVRADGATHAVASASIENFTSRLSSVIMASESPVRLQAALQQVIGIKMEDIGEALENNWAEREVGAFIGGSFSNSLNRAVIYVIADRIGALPSVISPEYVPLNLTAAEAVFLHERWLSDSAADFVQCMEQYLEIDEASTVSLTVTASENIAKLDKLRRDTNAKQGVHVFMRTALQKKDGVNIGTAQRMYEALPDEEKAKYEKIAAANAAIRIQLPPKEGRVWLRASRSFKKMQKVMTAQQQAQRPRSGRKQRPPPKAGETAVRWPELDNGDKTRFGYFAYVSYIISSHKAAGKMPPSRAVISGMWKEARAAAKESGVSDGGQMRPPPKEEDTTVIKYAELADGDSTRLGFLPFCQYMSTKNKAEGGCGLTKTVLRSLWHKLRAVHVGTDVEKSVQLRHKRKEKAEAKAEAKAKLKAKQQARGSPLAFTD
eukprot:TRINITY_DN1313_c0_g1_i5.p1 TRINITY_DN1313_c0_g1~~TRINITY_DN1313_c0_g1_i5.p1  ORF type:complete len:531 (+),score=188.19 TRINITY_DN1313_c0_g1_i5:364-1956(+)